MPDLVPVDHDPFGFIPVDHDPFAVNPDAALAASMTHQTEQPNPAKPYVEGVKNFARGGLSEVLKGAGLQLPEWSNRVGDVLQSEAANTAIGMTTPLKGMKGITAFHGSPHDFDKFDLSRIGTGEGAQAYGSGLYFAENEGVAKSYKTAGARSGAVTYNGGGIPNIDRQEWATLPRKTQDALLWLRDEPSIDSGIANAHSQDKTDIAKEIERLRSSGKISELAPGKMYQVSINADPEHFLDWDKPLSEQSDKVKEIVGNLTGRKTSGAGSLRSGQWWHDEVASKVGGDPVSTTNALRAAGIPGIKYLDQGSRAGGEGTSNYVVFDDKLIDILKKYGIAGIGALPAMGAYHFTTQQVDHDPFERQ